jgi:hypothetical protein
MGRGSKLFLGKFHDWACRLASDMQQWAGTDEADAKTPRMDEARQ